MSRSRNACSRSSTRPHRQRGVATMVIVMVLFFIISLVAAYTNRNLIFEQRTSANQYRSTQALEAADAGLEWALSMLNHGRITASCQDSTVTTDTTFRSRYLAIDQTNGNVRTMPVGGAPLQSSCVFVDDTTGWNCSCPSTGEPVLTLPSATAVHPAFRVRFHQITPLPPAPPKQPGVIHIEAVGCTRLDAECLKFEGRGVTNEGRAVVSMTVALAGNLASPPLAAVLAGGAVTGAAKVYNTKISDSGITVHAGGTVAWSPISVTPSILQSSPGTPAMLSKLESDPSVAPEAVAPYSAADRMFATVFNMWPATFRDQPAALRLTSCGAVCTSTDVNNALILNPRRPIWVPGSLLISSSVGTPAEPVLLVIGGDLEFVASSTISGLVYMRKSVANVSGAGQITGAFIAESDVNAVSSPVFVYDDSVLRALRSETGSFVRVPGSWRDFGW